MLTRDEVTLAYRLILGREPESAEVVDRHLTNSGSLAELRNTFLLSAEFQELFPALLGGHQLKKHMPAKEMSVDLHVTSDQMKQLLGHVTDQWSTLGVVDPFWSVLTHENYRKDRISSHIDAFYASGQAEINQFGGALARANISWGTPCSCLELGCGVGRVTLALAQRYSQVTGVDVSASHLKLAQEASAQRSIKGISWHHLTAIEELTRLGRFDVVYSRIVLQHNPPPIMLRLIEDMLWLLNPGGVAYFQLPTYKAGYRFKADEFLRAESMADMDMHYLPQAVVLEAIARSRCAVLEIREDSSIGPVPDSISNTFLVRKAAY